MLPAYFKNKVLIYLSVLLSFSAYAINDNNTKETIIDWSQSNKKTVNTVFVKPYQQLLVSTKLLQENIVTMCEAIRSPQEKNVALALNHSQDTFRNMFKDWANVQFISIGPMAYLKRSERFQYWPDKHSVGSRQLQRLIQEENHKLDHHKPVLTLVELQKKSVAVQGIPALERILFSQRLAPNNTECHIALLISQNLHDIATNNSKAWTQAPTFFANELANLSQGFGVYESEAVVANIFFNILSTQLLVIEQLKLQRALPQSNKPSKPTRLEAWKSQLSLPLIQENIHSLQQLYYHAFYPHLSRTHPSLAKKIMDEFKHTTTLIDESQKTLFTYVNQKSVHPTIEKLLFQLTTLQTLINANMASALNFTSKFNALDGD